MISDLSIENWRRAHILCHTYFRQMFIFALGNIYWEKYSRFRWNLFELKYISKGAKSLQSWTERQFKSIFPCVVEKQRHTLLGSRYFSCKIVTAWSFSTRTKQGIYLIHLCISIRFRMRWFQTSSSLKPLRRHTYFILY